MGCFQYQRIYHMFRAAFAFNQHLSSWDVSSVTIMHSMFLSASAFNENLSAWDHVVSITTMQEMFRSASVFNQDLSAWDVSSITSMYMMFRSLSAFNQDLSTWDVSSVITMYMMFETASAFNQDLITWDVSQCHKHAGDVSIHICIQSEYVCAWASKSPQLVSVDYIPRALNLFRPVPVDSEVERAHIIP
eukprot:scaffold11757_cov83-Attheya_sp.AAC.1